MSEGWWLVWFYGDEAVVRVDTEGRIWFVGRAHPEPNDTPLVAAVMKLDLHKMAMDEALRRVKEKSR